MPPLIFTISGVPWDHAHDMAVPCPTCTPNFFPAGGTATAQQVVHSVTPVCPLPPTPVEPHAWGAIKALWR
jgi:hypothetical protein